MIQTDGADPEEIEDSRSSPILYEAMSSDNLFSTIELIFVVYVAYIFIT